MHVKSSPSIVNRQHSNIFLQAHIKEHKAMSLRTLATKPSRKVATSLRVQTQINKTALKCF